MKHASTLRLYRCWAALKGRSPAPARADVRPRLLGSAMLDLFTLKTDALVFGYAGSRLRSGLPQKLDGLGFTVLWRPSDQADLLRLLHGIVKHHKPILLGARHAHTRVTSEHAEILLLPTLERSGEAGLIGSLSASRDWMAAGWPKAELALAAISTPEQSLHQEIGREPPRLPSIGSLRPRLISTPSGIDSGLAEILNRKKQLETSR